MKIPALLLTVVVLCLMGWQPRPAHSQEDLPPQVLAVQPFPGEEMPLDTPLTVIFDQAMDQESVVDAWSLNPPVEGAFEWANLRTLQFTPEGGWARGETYDLLLDEAASTTGGLGLQAAYTATIRAVGPLTVNSVVPADGTEGIAADATITVAFNRPVVPLGFTGDMAELPNPLTISPSPTGEGEWLNTSIFQFTPTEPLLGGADYTVTVNAGLEAVSGAVLDEPFSFGFKTLVPEILSQYPSGVSGETLPLDAKPTITFSQPMNVDSLEEGILVRRVGDGEFVPFALVTSSAGDFVSIEPEEQLEIDTAYNLVVDAEVVRGEGGANLREGRDMIFRTVPLPFVSGTFPRNGENNVSPGFRRVTIDFGTPMNPDTFEGKFEVTPDVGEITPVVYGNRSLGLEFEFEESTRYTVTLLAGAEDVYGNAIEADFTFSFNVGQVEPNFYMQDDRRFVVTGGYREDTALAATVTGDPTVQFAVYEVPTIQSWQSVYYIDDTRAQDIIAESALFREWEADMGQETTFADAKINLASDEGGALPLGLYLFNATYDPRGTFGRFTGRNEFTIREYYTTVAVTNTNITVKRMESEVLIWLTDMESAEPVVEQRVNIYDFGGTEPIFTAFTDGDGVLRVTEPLPTEIIIAAESETRFGLWHDTNIIRTPVARMYVYTDRPIYRPDETLHFRGVYRAQDDFDYTLTDREAVTVRVTDLRGTTLYDEKLPLTDFGSFSGELLLPEDTAVGNLRIDVVDDFGNYMGGVSAQIAEFRVPEFRVEVSPAQDEIIAGEPIRAIISGEFFSGGTVSNAFVSWAATANRTFFNYTGPGNYSFSDDQYPVEPLYFGDYYGYGGGRTLQTQEGQTDGSGQLLIEFDNTEIQGNSPETVTIAGTLNDESGQFITGQASVTVHPADIYVGVRTDQYFGRENQSFTAEVITVTPQSDIVPGKTVTLTLIERRWEREEIEGSFGRYNYVQREIEVESVRVSTDDSGRAAAEFTPPNAGIFVVRASTFDDLERTHTSATQLWVTGTGRVFWGQPSNNIDLIADADSYVPGDTAQILVPISLEGVSWVLVSVERDGVQSYEVVRVEGSTLVYELPITQQHEPGVFVSVMAVHGIDAENSVPAFRQGTLRLDVEPVSKRLNVMVTPSQSNAQPGDTVTLDIDVTDPDGAPVEGEFGLALVDEAILTLANPNTTDPETFFYGSVSNFTRTETMLSALIDGRLDEIFGQERRAEDPDIVDAEATEESFRSTGALGAFGGAAEADMAAAPMAQSALAFADDAAADGAAFDSVEIRTNFQQTPLWEAHVVTDANGRVQVTVTLPDNLTVWDLTARGFTVDTLVGDANLDIRSTLPLLVRPATPRFFVVGDEVTLAMVVNNNLDDAQEVSVTMRGEGFELLGGVAVAQTGVIEGNGRARFEWRVRIPDVEFVDLTFIAVGEDGYQDASRPPLATGPDDTIPVYRYTAPDTTGTGGVLRVEGARTEGISIPPIADTDQGTLTLQLDPSLAVTTIDALDYLENFEHQCIEQTVSRFLPNIITYNALTDLGVNDPVLEAKLQREVNFGLDRLLRSQNPDGGWGWFIGMESNPVVSTYAVFGLIEAQQAGFDVDRAILDRGASFVRSQLLNPTENTEPYMLNRQAFIFYVLSRADDGRYDPSLGELDTLLRVRLEMNYDALAYLLMSYNALGNRGQSVGNQVDSLTSDIISGARLSATGAHWEEPYRDWWNWGSDVRSTALVLAALIEAQPDSELLPNAVRWLMVAREGTHWASTQDTAWSILALSDWMVATNELDGNYDFSVALNGTEQISRTVLPDTVREGSNLVVAVGDLLLDEINRLTVVRGGGEGALYYTAHLQLRVDASEVDAIDRGLSVSREYLLNDEPVTEIDMGDIVTVRLTLTVPETLYYFVLEDPLPAGLEALDTSLLTTTPNVAGPQLQRQRDAYYYWWWWIWDHTEIRDESVNLYADQLPPGTYVYSYQAQATTPGDFQAMPAHGYAFYFPEVFGRSDGALFTVK